MNVDPVSLRTNLSIIENTFLNIWSGTNFCRLQGQLVCQQTCIHGKKKQAASSTPLMSIKDWTFTIEFLAAYCDSQLVIEAAQAKSSVRHRGTNARKK